MKKILFLVIFFFLFSWFLSPAHSENAIPENLLAETDSTSNNPVNSPMDKNNRETIAIDDNGETIAQWLGETLRERIIPEFTPTGDDGRPLSWEDLAGLPFKTWALIFFIIFITANLLSTLFGFLANISMILSFLCALLALAALFLG